MRVILLEDVAKTGGKYEIVDVKDGYGLNFLIPQGKARVATPEVEQEMKTLIAKEEERKEKAQNELITSLEGVSELNVVIEKKASDSGQLFGSVKEGDVLEAVKNTFGIELADSHVEFHQPIKELGTHTVPVKVEEREFTLSVEVVQA